MVLQALHNNYTSGVVSVAVSARGGLPELIYREREATYRLPVGLGRPKISQLTFRGDTYQVAALGRFTHDEEERPVFYIRLEFLETPCVRVLKLVLLRDGMLLRQTETPGVPYVFDKLRRAAEQAIYKISAAGGRRRLGGGLPPLQDPAAPVPGGPLHRRELSAGLWTV